MFIISTSKDKTINWPVKVEVAADGGKISKFEFTGTFKLLDDDDREALFPEADSADEEASTAFVKEQTVDNILKIMVDWKQVVDESKTPIEFNRDNLLAAARSVNGLAILRAINNAIGEIRVGARAKN
ncbi:hypothetical protein [Massilia rhizosphaerae]|uniref:hypothetical protein n=1 Tax=Massilia rhizosphaerae TaxID=2784389 RepID=UPI0018DD7D1C|nr:hypothetical protein [Massilia rhizosphaerae]